MNLPSRSSLRTFLTGALIAVVAMAVVLTIQDSRHGWPFAGHLGRSESSGHVQRVPPTRDTPAHASRRAITVDAAQFERLGVRLEPARSERIASTARYSAVVTPDEGRISHVHARVSGWVEQLHVNTTGERVRAGQVLAAVFSQDLFASQTEYLVALKRSSATPDSAVPDAARTRLKVLGMSDQEIAMIERTGSARRLLLIAAPRSGIVLRRAVTVGTAIDPSTELMTIADLSRVWVLAELPEGEGMHIKPGAPATLSFPGSGRESFSSPVDFIYPTLTERTRTLRVRFTVANPDATLRPGLYGTVTFDTQAHNALTIAREAVVDTGESQHVFVRTQNGVLEPRTVTLGAQVADRVEVREGIAPGEEVVIAGVFLIDSESRMRASGGGTGHAGHDAGPSAEPLESAKGPAESGHSPDGA